MIFESERELLQFTEGIEGKTFGEMDKLNLLDERNSGQRVLLGKVVETGFYGYSLNDETNLKSIGVELKVIPFYRRKDGEVVAKEHVEMSYIDYLDIINEEFESSRLLRENGKILFIWYEYLSGKELAEMEVKHFQLYDMLQDEMGAAIIKQDFEIIKSKVKNGEVHLLSEGDTSYLGASAVGKSSNKTFRNQPYSDVRVKVRVFSLKRNYMTILLRRISSEISFEQQLNPNGEGGISDQVTTRDLLGRNFLVKELGDFYIEYSETNNSPFYFGILARWGMGKSSVVQMLIEYISKQKSEKNEYIICKMDCSLFDKKEKLWITILNQLLEELSENKRIFSFKFLSFKRKFQFYNILNWFKGRWWLFAWYGILFGIIMYITSSWPSKLIPKDYKETAALITVMTLCITVFKTGTSLFKQNVLLSDNRSEDSSFIQSAKEYKQLINLMNKVKKEKNVKVLLVLDELDRIHRELLPDVIEFIQLFKGINEKRSNKEGDQIKDNESIISFAFSFNHDFLFPIIGKNVSLDDRQLLINSYHSYIEGEGKDSYINYYKLGK
ncbi:P-loop NTPase fold protein [Bacillus mycoides]|uniref:P-loop NTPase fold protein n=1 Tax=Bacillus mycoides TaxID=1405 RepID=UPI003D199FC3